MGTYRPGEFIFQYPIILPFHIVHGVLKAKILKWFAIPFPVDHVMSELSTMTRLSWVTMAWLIVSLIRQGCGPCDQFDSFSVIMVFILSAL